MHYFLVTIQNGQPKGACAQCVHSVTNAAGTQCVSWCRTYSAHLGDAGNQELTEEEAKVKVAEFSAEHGELPT